jgi:signal transduction histidine kinase
MAVRHAKLHWSRTNLAAICQRRSASVTVVRALVDAEGRLAAADPALLALQRAAGGDLDQPLLLPGIARLAYLAQRLRRRIERPVLAASNHANVLATGRFTPTAQGVRIELAEWQEQLFDQITTAGPDMNTRHAELLVNWACDVRLRLVMATPDNGMRLPVRNFLSHPLTELFLLQPDSDGQFPLLLALAQQSLFTGQSARLIDADGIGVQVSLSGEPMVGADGFTGFIGVARGYAPLSTPLEDAEAGQSGMGMLGDIDPRRFALRVDGAMRKPLGRIIANAETIAGQLQGPIRSDYARYASDIALAGRHLLDLVDDLADLQAVERPDFTTAQERVDLADLGRRAAGLLAMKANERDIMIDAPDADEHAPARAEFRRVLQILLNLIGNAVRYSPEGSTIWLRIEQRAGRSLITVADQGAGIAIEDQERLFEKFERLGRTDAGGSGLGLYISRRLARAMGGDIHLDSAPGQGARFTLDLPEWVERAPLSAG